MDSLVFPFRPGDRVPDIALPAADGKVVKLLWSFQGEPVVLVALGDAACFDDDVAHILDEVVTAGATPILVADSTLPAAKSPKNTVLSDWPLVLRDADRRYLRLLLAPEPAQGATAPARRFLVLDPNQRLVAQSAGQTRDATLAAIRTAITTARADRPDDSLLFGAMAPVLVLPRVFEPAFCAKLIQLWSAGERADGGVASRYGNVMAADRKRTEDHIVKDPEVTKQISDRLAYRIGPELAKVFAWDAEFGFDAHVIISYEAEGRHYFKAHRDNGTPQTADRTFAVSLNLNDDYEGGELVFPEYGPTRVKPRAGAAAVFSCSILHEALPVTRGRRFVLTTFFRNRSAQAQQPRRAG